MNPPAEKFRIYQIELTNFCNMRCTYCPHPAMTRDKGYMSEATLERCLYLAKTNGLALERLVVHHFGEPLLHFELAARLRQIAEAGFEIEFSTNGLLLAQCYKLLRAVPTKIHITLSAHQWSNHHPNVYYKELQKWRTNFVGTNVTINQAHNIDKNKLHIHKWTNGKNNSATPKNCFFLNSNYGVVLWNGDLVSCCADHNGESIIGNVHHDSSLFARTTPWQGCRGCDLFPGD